MNLGARCKYADQCGVFSGEIEVPEMPLHLLRNVFCNRGGKGWANCTRYHHYENAEKPGDSITPYS